MTVSLTELGKMGEGAISGREETVFSAGCDRFKVSVRRLGK